MNDSGMTPTGVKCVVKVKQIEAKTKGGVFLPEQHHERQQMAHTESVLVAVGGNAFERTEEGLNWKDPKPKVGDRVMINKYAGQFRHADPNDPYRLVNDTDILAIIED